jgi:hypothetical protein
LSVGNGGELQLAGTAQLVLTGAASSDGAKLDGVGKVVAGKTEISGGTAGAASWQVKGTPGAVTIEADKISASADTAVLTGVTGGTAPSITVLVDGTLTIGGNTVIDLAAAGSIVLTQGTASNGGKIDLSKTTAKITGLTGGSSDQNFTTSTIANATYTVGTAKGDVSGSATSGGTDGTIAGGNDTGPNPIQAKDSGSATIDKDTTIGSS